MAPGNLILSQFQTHSICKIEYTIRQPIHLSQTWSVQAPLPALPCTLLVISWNYMCCCWAVYSLKLSVDIVFDPQCYVLTIWGINGRLKYSALIDPSTVNYLSSYFTLFLCAYSLVPGLCPSFLSHGVEWWLGTRLLFACMSRTVSRERYIPTTHYNIVHWNCLWKMVVVEYDVILPSSSFG